MKYEAKLIDNKMMLISMDIKIGDKVQVFINNEWKYCNLYHQEEVNEWKEDNAFKVIGEISSQATWVKEGDEFESTELEFMFCEGSHAGISASLNRIKELSSSNKLRVKIKGSCGHYH